MKTEKGLDYKHEDDHRSYIRQYITALVVNLAIIGYAVHEGWSSPATLFLTSKQTTLPSGEITKGKGFQKVIRICVHQNKNETQILHFLSS